MLCVCNSFNMSLNAWKEISVLHEPSFLSNNPNARYWYFSHSMKCEVRELTSITHSLIQLRRATTLKTSIMITNGIRIILCLFSVLWKFEFFSRIQKYRSIGTMFWNKSNLKFFLSIKKNVWAAIKNAIIEAVNSHKLDIISWKY